MRLLLFVAVLLGFSATCAHAHKLKVFATLEGQTISGYGFFIGGGRPNGAEIVIKDKSARDVYHGKTDARGGFSFKTTGTSDYTIVVNTGEGHIAKALIEANRFSSPQPHRRLLSQHPWVMVILAALRKPRRPTATMRAKPKSSKSWRLLWRIRSVRYWRKSRLLIADFDWPISLPASA